MPYGKAGRFFSSFFAREKTFFGYTAPSCVNSFPVRDGALVIMPLYYLHPVTDRSGFLPVPQTIRA
jgi:hypothetical protein